MCCAGRLWARWYREVAQDRYENQVALWYYASPVYELTSQTEGYSFAGELLCK